MTSVFIIIGNLSNDTLRWRQTTPDHVSWLVFSFFMPQKYFNKTFEFLLYLTNRLHFPRFTYKTNTLNILCLPNFSLVFFSQSSTFLTLLDVNICRNSTISTIPLFAIFCFVKHGKLRVVILMSKCIWGSS